MDLLITSINSYIWYLSPDVIYYHGSLEHIKISSHGSLEGKSSNGDILEHIKISSNGSSEEHKSSSFGWTFCTVWFACIYECWTFIPDFYTRNNKHKRHHVADCHVEFHLTTFLPRKPNTPQQPTITTKNQKNAHSNNNTTTPADHKVHTNQKAQTGWQQRCQIHCRMRGAKNSKKYYKLKRPSRGRH